MLENLRDADDEQSRSSYLVESKPAEKSLSLRKLYLWSLEPLERLRWMSIKVFGRISSLVLVLSFSMREQ